ncbi:MAG TPA: neutral zinc metallopeptidase, partial [Trueperaceae bacterium]|nr:neutral zinc metallopeptidase [Trueperaceae bacterium]
GDQKVYLDLSFFEELTRRYAAPGDFAQAYVVAHELGHHVQNVLGTLSRAQSQGLSVPVELQADCYAGVWGASADRRGIVERGDLQEGLTAAAAVGDDTLAKRAGRIPNQETFTHGSSAQRTQWFTTGFQSGDPNACNTFGSR